MADGGLNGASIAEMATAADDDAGAFPEHLAARWDKLGRRRHPKIQGPWTNTGAFPIRTQFDREVRMLRSLGWTRAEIAELALCYPEGLGCLGSETGRLLDEIWAEIDAATKALSAAEATAKANPGEECGPFRVLRVGDLLKLDERDYLLKGIVSPGELSVWWGPPKCGKSFLLLHVAYALAQGRQVFGRRVRNCRVLYLACEGRSGLRGRIEALARRYGEASDFLAIAQPLDLGPVGEHVAAMRKAIEHFKPDLVVVDTINRVMAGGDENSSADMGALIRHLDELRAPLPGRQHGPHVAAIHHGTKEGRGGPRGHGSLLGAVDASIEVSADDDGNRTAKLDAMKDDAGGALAFRLDVEDLGPDPDGDPRTTCLVAEEGEAPARKRKGRALTETQAGWLRDLMDMFAEPEKAAELAPVEGMQPTLTLTRDEVRHGYRVRGRFTTEPNLPLTNADKVRLSTMLSALKDKGKIGMTADLVWLL